MCAATSGMVGARARQHATRCWRMQADSCADVDADSCSDIDIDSYAVADRHAHACAHCNVVYCCANPDSDATSDSEVCSAPPFRKDRSNR